MQGKTVINPCTSIKLFSICEAMKWSHLPTAGGLYDQHPRLLEEFSYIFSKRAEFQEKERQKEEAQRKRKSSGGRVAGRR